MYYELKLLVFVSNTMFFTRNSITSLFSSYWLKSIVAVDLIAIQ